MTPAEKIILVQNYIKTRNLNWNVEYSSFYKYDINKYIDTFTLIFGFKDRDVLPYNIPRIFDLDEHITSEEINQIQEILKTKNISFSLVKKEDFSIKLSLVLY